MSYQQTQLFRSSDPETSRLGAESITPNLSQLQTLFCERVDIWHQTFKTWPTAQEIARGNESLRKRAKELVRIGALFEADSRRCRVTGKQATTYGSFG